MRSKTGKNNRRMLDKCDNCGRIKYCESSAFCVAQMQNQFDPGVFELSVSTPITDEDPHVTYPDAVSSYGYRRISTIYHPLDFKMDHGN